MSENDKIVIGNNDALAVIDMQNDFICEDGALYVAGVEGEMSMEAVVINTKITNSLPFGLRITTGDGHPYNHIEFGIFGKHCVDGLIGENPHREVFDIYYHADMNLSKGEDADVIAYSISTSRQYASLIKKLREKQIKRIFLCGLAYTHCVGESAIALAAQGFEVYVVRDATRSVPPPYGDPEKMAQKLALYGVKEVTTDQLVGE